eukprot:3897370-Amphidinium_carterae.1
MPKGPDGSRLGKQKHAIFGSRTMSGHDLAKADYIGSLPATCRSLNLSVLSLLVQALRILATETTRLITARQRSSLLSSLFAIKSEL